ncbi:hypothetical protein C8J57DRAFT_1638813 [Mycena rebaudengoi]|nr:hypothetical protein C8J57DRAFT_1638813 [Mycena rebaudengoi]
MTIEGPVGDGEYNLIRLLECIIAYDPTATFRGKGPFIFVHPCIEHRSRTSDSCPAILKAYLYHGALLRNYYIMETLFGILETYNNRPPRPIFVGKFSDSPMSKSKLKKDAPACTKGVSSSQCKEEEAIAVHACYVCHKTCEEVSSLPIGLVLLRFNIPFDHTRSTTVPDPASRIFFLVARRRAVASGSPSAVYTMYKIMEYLQKKGTINLILDQIRRQFEKEYNIPLTPDAVRSAEPFTQPTQQEIDEESLYIFQRAASVS